jgi:hypothetical protein
MKKSYVQDGTLQISITIDLGEINDLITQLESVVGEEGKNWRAKELITKLRTVRRDAAEEARREFQNIIEAS